MLGIDLLWLVVMGAGVLLTVGAQLWVSAAVGAAKHIPSARGMSGRDVAAAILAARGLRGVRVEETHGFLGDHYDPSSRTLRLSADVFHGRSVAAAGIAAHEVGHALQHAEGYAPMRARQALVPVANIGTNLGALLVVVGAAIGAVGLAKLGVALFAGFVAFTLITLPVEFDASARARRVLAASGWLTREELDGVGRVLRAAAATYVAAAASAVLQLLYFVLRVHDDRREA